MQRKIGTYLCFVIIMQGRIIENEEKVKYLRTTETYQNTFMNKLRAD